MPMTTPTRREPATQLQGRPATGWRLRLYTVIFEADTRAGRQFDLTPIVFILASVTVVVLDSMGSVRARYNDLFNVLEWAFTLVFSVECIAWLVSMRHPLRYARSGFGVIDLLALLPTYLAISVRGVHALVDVRALRLLRIFRVLKMGAYVAEFGALGRALAASRRKILVLMAFVMLVVLVMGTLAVPTGILSAEFTARRVLHEPTTRSCHECLSEGYLPGARLCMNGSVRFSLCRVKTSTRTRSHHVAYSSCQIRSRRLSHAPLRADVALVCDRVRRSGPAPGPGAGFPDL